MLRERDGAVVRQAREDAPVANRLVPGQLDQLADRPVRAVPEQRPEVPDVLREEALGVARRDRSLHRRPHDLELGEVARARAPRRRARCSAARAAGGRCRARGRPSTPTRATWAPKRGTSSTSPSPARMRRASRTGERLTPACWASFDSVRRVPGGSSPAMIRRASQSATVRESSLWSSGWTPAGAASSRAG